MNGWLCVSVDKSKIAYAGNDGYDEELGIYYSWDSTVNNASQISEGDLIAIWNKKELLGFSIVDRIELDSSSKKFFVCPSCKKSAIKARKTMAPIYRCQECRETFDQREETVDLVKVYRAFYESGWTPITRYINGAECRAMAISVKDQNSLRRIDMSKFEKLIGELPKVATSRYRRRTTEIAGGHHLRTVRVRKGQRQFRERLVEQFGYVCAFSGSNHSTSLEAAHLYRYSDHGVHHEDGGLLIRRDIHSLFDADLISVNPNTLLIEIHEDLRDIPTYKELDGCKLQVTVNSKTKSWLKTHWEQVHS
jgi:hypothetical protein